MTIDGFTLVILICVIGPCVLNGLIKWRFK